NVTIELAHLHFVPYEDALSLISQITHYTASCDTKNDDAAYIKARGVAADALAGHLWEVARVPDYPPLFVFAYEGAYDYLRLTNDTWVKNGVDPFDKWGGDRG